MLRSKGRHVRRAIYFAASVVLGLFLWDALLFYPESNFPFTRIQHSHKGQPFFALHWSNFLKKQPNSVAEKNDAKEISAPWGYGHRITTCSDVREHEGFLNACEFVRAHGTCKSDSLIDYTRFFFCFCGNSPLLGHISLIVWLVALFYILGNTAADYFCCSIEKLSKFLRLSPTMAGVTLLPFGNGAPDLFASIASIMGSNNGEVGLNSVLGGAVFIICIVAGSVILLVAGTSVNLDRNCFIRDVSFFLVALVLLGLILVVGKITFVEALVYVSVYLVYAITVAAWECFSPLYSSRPHLPSSAEQCTGGTCTVSPKLPDEGGSYLLLQDPELALPLRVGKVAAPLYQFHWFFQHFLFSEQDQSPNTDKAKQLLWGQKEEEQQQKLTEAKAFKILQILPKVCELLIERPLALPRRLTIPIVEEDKWSKFYAVSSAILAPVLVAFVVDHNGSVIAQGLLTSLGFCCGCILGILAYFTTHVEHPPRKFAFIWVCGGFFMSLFWFYLIAKELVAVLISLGLVLEINPAVLALTLLAWGDSCGDLVSNIALASNGGDDVQIAFSACYAGPMFNTLMGLGLSLVLATWKATSGVYMIPEDDNLFLTVGFLVAALIWALLLLSSNNMQPTRLAGIGLLILYAIFLTLQISSAVGFSLFKGGLPHQ